MKPEKHVAPRRRAPSDLVERDNTTPEAAAWSVPIPVHAVPFEGRHLDLLADDQVRAKIASVAGLIAVKELEAHFDLVRIGKEGLRVRGQVTGLVAQACVVTLERVENRVTEPVDVTYLPADAATGATATVHTLEDEDPPEFLRDGTIDLGTLAVEFLLLGLDPYPRAPGAALPEPAAEQHDDRPFAALAALTGCKPSGSSRS